MPENIPSPALQAPDTGADDLHRLSMTILMTPDMSNFAGNVHGGTLLKYLDQVAYTCATRYARNYAVTLSVDQVVFREPIHVGELVTFDASVNRTGRTSISRWWPSDRTADPCPSRRGSRGRPRNGAGIWLPSDAVSYGGTSIG